MSENFTARLSELPGLLASHLLLSVCALALAVGASVPLGIWLSDRPRLRDPMLAVAGAAQTIPSLALLALMVPFLTWTNGLGIGLPALGFAPALAALSVYGVLPILRNTVTGILGVDAASVNAARAVGMTRGQRRRAVELPLALPVIVTGIRTATVWVVGTATLATPVGQRCLGNYIFTGLQTSNGTMVMFGVVGAAALALTLDGAIGAIEAALTRRAPRRALGLTIALALVIAFFLTLPSLVGNGARRSPSPGITTEGNTPSPHTALDRPLRIGAKTFSEQYILASLLERTLAEGGLSAERVEGLGSTIVFDALVAGEIDVTIDYSGTLWANGMKRSGASPPWSVLAEISGWLATEHEVRLLGSLGFENAYALAVRSADAERLELRTIGDLAAHAPSMKIGGDYEFFGRQEWQSIVSAYGIEFSEELSFDPTLMYPAIGGGQVDVISAFSSDGRIATFDLVVLEDPKRALPPYDAVLLLSKTVANDPAVISALTPLVGAIDLVTMQRANAWVDRKENPLTVERAAEQLADEIAN